MTGASIATDAEQASTIIRVTTAEELTAALDAATGGETILLADGDYGDVKLKYQFSSNVTIQAETVHGARFTGLLVQNSLNLTMDGLFLDYDPEAGDALAKSPFEIIECASVTLRNSLLEGGAMNDPDDPGHGDPIGRGLRVRSSTDVLVEDNELRNFWKAMNTAQNDGLVIRGNDIHSIRSDGINVVASENVLIEDNHIHDFLRNLETGDHPDMIQMFTTSGLIPSNITIRNNYLDVGDGAPVQSIFLTHNAASRAAHGEDLAYSNITITGNVIVNGQVHGISVGETDGLVVANNTLIRPPGSDFDAPRIAISTGSTDVTVTDNIAERIQHIDAVPEGWDMSGNILAQMDDPEAPNHYSDIFINAMSDATSVPENLQLLPGGDAEMAGAGAPQLIYDSTPEELTALARPEHGAWMNEFVFDGSYSAGPLGAAAAAGAVFHWDFGDGRTGTGEEVTHGYKQPGVYTAVLTVTLPDGSADTTEVVVQVRNPDLLNFQDGTLELHGPEETVVVDPGFAPEADGSLRFESGTAIVFDGPSGEVFENACSMNLAMRLRAEEGGTVLGVKTGFTVRITADGELEVYTSDLPGAKLQTDGANLLDGALHDIAVVFNGASQTITLTVNGVDMLTADAGAALLPAMLDGNQLRIGAMKQDNGFTGTLEMLDLDLNADQYSADMGMDTSSLQNVALDYVPGDLEIGTLSLEQTGRDSWVTVTFSETINDARVVMGPLEAAGKAPAVVRLRNVTDQGFEFQIDEWDYLNGRHEFETISWMAASAGEHTLSNGQRLIVGRDSLTDTLVTEVELNDFAGGLVMSQVTSAEESDAVVSRVSDVDADGFSLRMQEQESKSGAHATETVDWIAIESASDGFVFQDLEVSDGWHQIAGPGAGQAVLGAMQSLYDADTAALRYRMDKSGELSLRVEEEKSADRETAHLAEDVMLFFADEGRYELYA